MFNEVKLAEVKTRLRGGESLADPLSEMSESDLRKLRSEIDRLLPEAGINGLNLEDELIEQYHKTKGLMDDTLSSDDAPANQKAQVCNSVVTILGSLVKLQEDLKREQTMKIMEATLVDVIKTLPEDRKVEFFTEYERLAKLAGLL